jgi:CPA2 family monovalent cation:H+ antiporter-2
VAAKVLTDLGRLGNRETPAVLNLLVMEDLAMALYLPVVGAVVAGTTFGETVVAVVVAFAAVALILVVALRWGHGLSRLLSPGSDEAVLLSVFGLTLLVGGLAQRVQVSAAIGAFLVGLALSGPVQERAGTLVQPLRDLFAATFFLFFSYQIRPGALTEAIVPAMALAALGTGGKLAAGWVAAAPLGVGRNARLRAGSVLVARGEFSIVIASLGAGLANGADLRALAAAFVLLTATAGPVLTKAVDRMPIEARAPAAIVPGPRMRSSGDLSGPKGTDGLDGEPEP